MIPPAGEAAPTGISARTLMKDGWVSRAMVKTTPPTVLSASGTTASWLTHWPMSHRQPSSMA